MPDEGHRTHCTAQHRVAHSTPAGTARQLAAAAPGHGHAACEAAGWRTAMHRAQDIDLESITVCIDNRPRPNGRHQCLSLQNFID